MEPNTEERARKDFMEKYGLNEGQAKDLEDTALFHGRAKDSPFRSFKQAFKRSFKRLFTRGMK